MARWYKGLKGQTIVTPDGLVVVNKGSVKLIDETVVEKQRYIERGILEEVEEAAAGDAVAANLNKVERQSKAGELSPAKAARHRARAKHALKIGVDPSIRSPMKARAEKKKAAAKGRKAAPAAAPAPDAPPAA